MKKNKIDARTFKRKSSEMLRVERIEIVLSPDEKDLIIEQARKAHMPVSVYIRFKLLTLSV